MQTDTNERIRRLNDRLRRDHAGGRVLVTTGVQGLGAESVIELLKAIAQFDDFSTHNDPWDEHDCAAIDFDGQRYLWKIDYYDKSLEFGSPDSSDPAVTERVMTVMRSDEY